MADEPDLGQLPEATVIRKKRMRISIVWIIPILAALVAIGIAIQRIRSEGPTITIIFNAAEGGWWESRALARRKTLSRKQGFSPGEMERVSTERALIAREHSARAKQRSVAEP